MSALGQAARVQRAAEMVRRSAERGDAHVTEMWTRRLRLEVDRWQRDIEDAEAAKTGVITTRYTARLRK